MSKADVEYDLEDTLRSKDRVFVLFYASWCPYSRRFLPTFEKFAQDKSHNCLSVVVDDKASLCEKYSIEVYPTVLVFDKGKLVRRLDGALGVGLDEGQLMSLASATSILEDSRTRECQKSMPGNSEFSVFSSSR
jgi:thiol-disulfide isomerase/thioredoxin